MTTLSRSQRAADAVTQFCGSWMFILIGSVATAGWIVYNRGNKTFDPYPYILFNLVLTIVSTFQSPLIMMSQNRQIERDKIAAAEQAALDRELVQELHDKLNWIIRSTADRP